MENNKRTMSLKTTEIDGGIYTLIAERIKHLANEFSYKIDTTAEFVEVLDSWKVKAVLTIIEDGVEYTYSGHALEVIGSNEINMTSALENAETSAVGRACANAGIGLTDSFASGDEVRGAKEALKNEKVNQRKNLSKTAESKALDILTANNRKNNEK